MENLSLFLRPLVLGDCYYTVPSFLSPLASFYEFLSFLLLIAFSEHGTSLLFPTLYLPRTLFLRACITFPKPPLSIHPWSPFLPAPPPPRPLREPGEGLFDNGPRCQPDAFRPFCWDACATPKLNSISPPFAFLGTFLSPSSK